LSVLATALIRPELLTTDHDHINGELAGKIEYLDFSDNRTKSTIKAKPRSSYYAQTASCPST